MMWLRERVKSSGFDKKGRWQSKSESWLTSQCLSIFRASRKSSGMQQTQKDGQKDHIKKLGKNGCSFEKKEKKHNTVVSGRAAG